MSGAAGRNPSDRTHFEAQNSVILVLITANTISICCFFEIPAFIPQQEADTHFFPVHVSSDGGCDLDDDDHEDQDGKLERDERRSEFNGFMNLNI